MQCAKQSEKSGNVHRDNPNICLHSHLTHSVQKAGEGSGRYVTQCTLHTQLTHLESIILHGTAAS